MSSLVLTVVATDRPGLVAALSDTIAAHGGSWTESQLARLAGSFAGVLLVDIDASHHDQLTAALRELTEHGVLDVSVAPAPAGAAQTQGSTLRFQLTGNDRPGIVRDLSQALAEIDASIEELSTRTAEAPMAGGHLFVADVVVRVPEHRDEDDVRTALEALAGELMVDVEDDDD